MTNIQRLMATLQTTAYSEDYYVNLYEYSLAKHEMSYAGISRYVYSDEKIVAMCNDFWLDLPDDPAIRRRLWTNCVFSTKREAEVYAYLWCNSVTRDVAEKIAPSMEIGKDTEFRSSLTMGEPVIMRIIEECA